MIEELTIEASHQCQLNCRFCSSKNTIFNIKPNDKLGLNKIKEAIKKLKPKIVRWSGGEPFIYLNRKIIKEISLFPFIQKQIVTTNGMLPSKILSLADCFAEVRVSVYGDERRHDALTTVSGSWNRAVQTIKMLKGITAKKATKIFITSPYISAAQIREVNNIAKNFKIGIRITGLVPTRFFKIQKKVRGLVCSLGGEDCRYHKKRLILPNGKVIHCATEKAAFQCPYLLKYGKINQ